MIDEAKINLCEPAPSLYHENGLINVTDGSHVWLVIVTCEAMKATATPPDRSLRRLVRYAAFYRDLAATVIMRGQDVDGKIWVTEAAVTSSVLPGSQGARGGPSRHGEGNLKILHARHGS
jgi:hypothetical protein